MASRLREKLNLFLYQFKRDHRVSSDLHDEGAARGRSAAGCLQMKGQWLHFLTIFATIRSAV